MFKAIIYILPVFNISVYVLMITDSPYLCVVSRIFNDSQRFLPHNANGAEYLNTYLNIILPLYPTAVLRPALLPSPLPSLFYIFRLEQPSKPFHEIVRHKHVSRIPGVVGVNFQYQR